jgi:hypothetical protein
MKKNQLQQQSQQTTEINEKESSKHHGEVHLKALKVQQMHGDEMMMQGMVVTTRHHTIPYHVDTIPNIIAFLD